MATTTDPTATLPQYAAQLTAFHRAFAPELQAIVASLPLTPTMRVLDVGCGDGFYVGLFAERLLEPGGVVGLDPNAAFLDLARQQPALEAARCQIEFLESTLEVLVERGPAFDLAWCAQSLYSLPEPTEALAQMRSVVQPGGIVAVLENDTLHQVLLPWPTELEIALRAAEYVDFCRESEAPGKYYVGRRLPSVFAEAGLEPLGFRTQCIDRQTPLNADLEAFLQSYLERMAERVGPSLNSALRREFEALLDPGGEQYLLRQEHFTMSWLNVLVWGRRK
jgi:SAM-dependent methyltransferase